MVVCDYLYMEMYMQICTHIQKGIFLVHQSASHISALILMSLIVHKTFLKMSTKSLIFELTELVKPSFFIALMQLLRIKHRRCYCNQFLFHCSIITESMRGCSKSNACILVLQILVSTIALLDRASFLL